MQQMQKPSIRTDSDFDRVFNLKLVEWFPHSISVMSFCLVVIIIFLFSQHSLHLKTKTAGENSESKAM